MQSLHWQFQGYFRWHANANFCSKVFRKCRRSKLKSNATTWFCDEASVLFIYWKWHIQDFPIGLRGIGLIKIEQKIRPKITASQEFSKLGRYRYLPVLIDIIKKISLYNITYIMALNSSLSHLKKPFLDQLILSWVLNKGSL